MAKIRSVHTYVIPWIFYFGGQCIKYKLQNTDPTKSKACKILHTHVMTEILTVCLSRKPKQFLNKHNENP